MLYKVSLSGESATTIFYVDKTILNGVLLVFSAKVHSAINRRIISCRPEVLVLVFFDPLPFGLPLSGNLDKNNSIVTNFRSKCSAKQFQCI